MEGVSTRRVDDLIKALGCDGISSSQVSRICEQLDEVVESFLGRPLDGGPYPYVWLDGLTQKVREGGRVVNVCVVVATGVNADGQREILGMDVGASEDGAFWLAFLRSLTARGLSGVELVTSDAHQGLKNAIAAVFAGASWQRCRTHFMANLLTRVPKRALLSLSKGRRGHPGPSSHGAHHLPGDGRPVRLGYGVDKIAQGGVLADGDGVADIHLAADRDHGVGVEAAVGPHDEWSGGPSVAYPSHRLTQEVGGAASGVGSTLAQPSHQHVAGASDDGQQRVIAPLAGVAVVARSLLEQSVGLTDGGIQVYGQRPVIIQRSGSRPSGPGQQLPAHPIQLASVAPTEAPQECPQGGWRLDHAAQHPRGPASTQHVGIVNAVATGQSGCHQRHDLVARVGSAWGTAQVQVLVNQLGQAQMPSQRGRQDQPSMLTRRWSSKAIWIRSGWLRGSIYLVLLLLGWFGVSQTIIPEAKGHFLTPSTRPDTHLFGGLGLISRVAVCPQALDQSPDRLQPNPVDAESHRAVEQAKNRMGNRRQQRGQ